ncbi:MAG: hypothetical protein HYS59_00815 [Candidatus Vogelbacteria bacterium]|nr:hypothetical protein [Candidatus Vogelbacteria bacterium]
MSDDMLGRIVRILVTLPMDILGTVYDLLQKVFGSEEARKEWQEPLRKFLRKENPWPTAASARPPNKRIIRQWLRRWQGFYREVFSIELDIEAVKLPANNQEGFDALLVVAKGTTLTMAWDATKRLLGNTWQWWEEGKTIEDAYPADKQARTPASVPYAIWHRGGREADEETRNLSTKRCDELGLLGMTLLERLLLGLFWFWEKKEHVDVESMTRCSGSCDARGGVPSVDWRSARGVHVDGGCSTVASPRCGVRAAVP